MNTTTNNNPFLQLDNPAPWGPGSLEMAKQLVEACNIQPGMRVLEVGGGSGQIASVMAKHWNVQVITLEPWTDGKEIQENAQRLGVANQVLAMKVKAQEMPFPDGAFDAVISIGSFEMIGEERPIALKEMIRVTRNGARIGIAEPMRHPVEMPSEMAQLDTEHQLGFQQCFSTLEWNCDLFQQQGLQVVENRHFTEAGQWWMEYREKAKISDAEKELIHLDQGRWLSLGMVVGEVSK